MAELAQNRRLIILVLAIVTPGIPEYLTGSSNFSEIVFSTPSFFVALFLDIGMYTAGALLIREFSVRFRKGWISILLLGCAYGIMEEGIAVHSFFLSSTHSVASTMAVYGRFAGTDWSLVLGIDLFHSIFSIALPLLLLKLAYPEISGKSLLGKRGLLLTLIVYMGDVALVNFSQISVTGSAPTPGEYVLFIAAAIVLVMIAYILPSGFGMPKGIGSDWPAGRFYTLGIIVFPLYIVYAFLIPNLPGSLIPPFADAILYAGSYLLLLAVLIRHLPVHGNELLIKNFALGLVIGLLLLSAFEQIFLVSPLIIVPMIIAIYMMIRLNRSVKERRKPDII